MCLVKLECAIFFFLISSKCHRLLNTEGRSTVGVTPPAHYFIEFEQVLPSCSLPLRMSLVNVVHVFMQSIIDLTLSLGSRSRWAQGPPFLPLFQCKQLCYEQSCLPTLTYHDYNVHNQSFTNHSDGRSAKLLRDMGSEQGLASFRFHWFQFSNCWYLSCLIC